jgi:outer membrane receptor protein involved in Fe transport
MLYGQTGPGGLFNYVTKTPSQSLSGNVGVVAGNFDRYGAQAEATGPVNDVLSARGGAFYQARNLPRTFAENQSQILDGGATLDFDVAKLTLQALRVEQDLPGNRLPSSALTRKPRAGYIVALEGPDDGGELLQELLAWQTRPEFVYEHRWDPVSLIMWDNRMVLHRATGGYDGDARFLHRTRIADRPAVKGKLQVGSVTVRNALCRLVTGRRPSCRGASRFLP